MHKIQDDTFTKLTKNKLKVKNMVCIYRGGMEKKQFESLNWNVTICFFNILHTFNIQYFLFTKLECHNLFL